MSLSLANESRGQVIKQLRTSVTIRANHAPLFHSTFIEVLMSSDIERAVEKHSVEIRRKRNRKKRVNCVSFQRLKLVCIMKY